MQQTHRSQHVGIGPQRVPYGFYWDRDTKQRVVDENENEICKLIAELYWRGYGYRHIGRELDMLGVPPRSGDLWNRDVIRRILERLGLVGLPQVHKTLPRPSEPPATQPKRCGWCFKAGDLGRAANCMSCGHRLDVPRYACDCEVCKLAR